MRSLRALCGAAAASVTFIFPSDSAATRHASTVTDRTHPSPLCYCDSGGPDKEESPRIARGPGSASSIFPQGNSSPHNNEDSKRKSAKSASSVPCETYNSAWHRLQWAERRNRCCEQSGCVFLGRSITGTCTPVDASARRRCGEQDDSPASTEIDEIGFTVTRRDPGAASPREESGLVKLYVEVASEKTTEPIKILLRDSITASAVDSLRGSQQLANELSKKMVLDYLSTPANVGITATFVASLLSNPQVRSNIWAYVPYLLDQPQVRRSVDQYAYYLRDYYIRPRGAGRPDTLRALVDLLDWWLQLESTRQQTVAPLLAWALLLEESVMIPAADLAAWALPAAQVKVISTW